MPVRRTLSVTKYAPLTMRRVAVRSGSKMARAGALSSRRAGAAPNPGGSRTPVSSKSVKAITVDQANAVLSTSGSVVLLDPVAQGTGENERLGLKWKDKAVHIRGELEIGSAADTPSRQMVTMYVVWDKQPNGSLATVSQILDDQTTSVFDGFYNLEHADRFNMIWKKNFSLVKQIGAAGEWLDKSHYVIDEYIKLPSCVAVGTQGGTGVIADRKTGSLLMLFTGDGTAATTPNTFNYSTRVYFDDV